MLVRASVVQSAAQVVAASWRWGIAASYAAAIVFASSRSSVPDLPGGPSDKLLHALAYAGLCVCVIVAATRGRWREATARVVLVSALACVLYGITDEGHQSFVPGRDASAGDVAADALGSFAAAGAVYAWGIISRGSRRRDAV